MNKVLIFIPVLAVAVCFYGCKNTFNTFDPDTVLIANRPLPQVLTVGCFHFNYPNLDAHKIAEDKQKNVLSPEGQREMEALVEHIARFKPSKIVVEAGRNTGYLLRRYEAWQQGKEKLRANEIDQIAFRLMAQFQLDTLYGCDQPTLVWDLWDHRDSLVLHPIIDSIYTDWGFDCTDPISQRYKALYQGQDELFLNWSLLKIFSYLNSETYAKRDFGAYLNGCFKNGTNQGADALAMHWYSRNLRIFRRIQDITTSPDDRILVLFGAGHTSILSYFFDCSPEYQRIPFADLK